MRVMAGGRGIRLVTVGVKVVVLGDGRCLSGYEPANCSLWIDQAIGRLGGIRFVSVRYVF